MNDLKEKLLHLGFTVEHMGGGCLGYVKRLEDGEVVVTDCDGGLQFDHGDWIVGQYDREGYEVQSHWHHASDPFTPTRGEQDIRQALAACGVRGY